MKPGRTRNTRLAESKLKPPFVMSRSTKVISTCWIRETAWELLRRTGHLSPEGESRRARTSALSVGLYKIFVRSKAFLHYPIILALPPPSALLTLLQYYCTTIAQYTTPTRPPLCLQYTIQHWQWQYRVKAKLSEVSRIIYASKNWGWRLGRYNHFSWVFWALLQQ